MNGILKGISEVCGVGSVEAQDIRDYIEEWMDPDYSEMSQRQLNQMYRDAQREMAAK